MPTPTGSSIASPVNGPEQGTNATNCRVPDLWDVIVVPSRTRPDIYHLVHVNVLAGCTDGCSCEAGQKGEMCWARTEVEASEGSWGFARCTTCGSLMHLGFWTAGTGPVRVWSCPMSDEHTGHEAGVRDLYRIASGAEAQSYAVGSRGSWRLA